MSKTTTYRSPYANGSYSINGETKASTQKRGNTVYGNYNMNSDEQAVYDYAQKTLSQILPQINTFSNETMNNIQEQLNAYQSQGQKTINNIYTPLINNLKNDIANRFGNINNSMFLDKLSNIENSRADAVAQLAQNLILQQNDLINNELSNRYNLVNLLNGLQSQYNNNALSMLSSALSLGNSVKGTGTQTTSSMDLGLSSLLSILSVL